MSQILYHVIGKKHERIEFMSHTPCISTLSDSNDKTINFHVFYQLHGIEFGTLGLFFCDFLDGIVMFEHKI